MTYRQIRWTMAGLALFAAACDKKAADAPATGKPATAVAAPAGSSWTETVVATPEGGFLMGNPNAAVKLVEYASLTCPHCAHFSETGAKPLRDKYVSTGKVSWEFRNFLLNPIDVVASLLARCQGPGPVFKLTEQLYAEQGTWAARFSKIPDAEIKRIGTLPESQQFAELAKAGQLDQFFTSRGLPQARVDACLADKAALAKLVEIRDRGTKQDGVTGTPSFLINNKLVDGAFGWETLEPKLREAIGG